jgi:hypothetical protein
VLGGGRIVASTDQVHRLNALLPRKCTIEAKYPSQIDVGPRMSNRETEQQRKELNIFVFISSQGPGHVFQFTVAFRGQHGSGEHRHPKHADKGPFFGRYRRELPMDSARGLYDASLDTSPMARWNDFPPRCYSVQFRLRKLPSPDRFSILHWKQLSIIESRNSEDTDHSIQPSGRRPLPNLKLTRFSSWNPFDSTTGPRVLVHDRADHRHAAMAVKLSKIQSMVRLHRKWSNHSTNGSSVRQAESR